jgi:hypothetical protein
VSTKYTTICLLLYGDYPKLHRSALDGLLRSDLSEAHVRVWCNVVCPQTLTFLLKTQPVGWQIYVNSANRPKYKLMRDMFYATPISTPWITWLDDDTQLLKPNWAVRTRQYLTQTPTVDFCGLETNGRYYRGGFDLVKTSVWYTGKPFGIGKSRHVYGAYWWLKTGVQRALAWPDHRLSHNGGDWLLSEALRQQSFKQVDYHYGINVQVKAVRRGRSEVSLGRRDKKVTSHSDKQQATMLGKADVYKQMLTDAGVNFDNLDNETILFSLPSGSPLVVHSTPLVPIQVQPATPVLAGLRSRGRAPADGAVRRFIKVPPRAPKRHQVYAQAEVKPKPGLNAPRQRKPERTLKQLLQIRQQKQQRR